MTSAPEGTIALLFTDIEGSTRLARELGEAWRSVLADHHRLLEEAIASEGGFVAGVPGRYGSYGIRSRPPGNAIQS